MDFVQLFISICYLISFIALSLGEDCSKVDQCSCKTSKYTIDLNPLVGNGASNPRFSVSGGDYTYDFEPCQPLASCGDSKSAAVCQHKDANYFDAGDASTAIFEGEAEANSLKIVYSSDERKSFIQLQCACEEGIFSFVKEDPPTQYNFVLKTKYACTANPCPPKPNSVGGLSAGSVLLILFFVFLAVYFIGGILFLKFVRGAQGTEMVPNVEFWKAIPGLIKDGIAFTCRGCKKDSTYSQI